MKFPRQLFYSIFATLILLVACIGDLIFDIVKLTFKSVVSFFETITPLWNLKGWK